MTTPFLVWLRAAGARIQARTFAIDLLGTIVPGFHDCSAILEIEGKTFRGRGQAQREDLALSKAAAEAIERWLVERAPDRSTSNGFAVHPTLSSAVANARRELIERDAFLCHMLTRTPFNPLNTDVVDPRGEFALFARHLARVRIDTRMGLLPTESGLHVVICAAFGARFTTPFGAAIGLGSHLSLARAMEKAWLECWGGLMPMLCGAEASRGLSRAAFRRAKVSVDAHHRFALHRDGGDELAPFFASRSPVEVARRSRPRLDTRIWHRLPRPLQGCPLFGVRLRSPSLQPLFFGVPQRAHLNLGRLEEFRANRRLPPGEPRSDLIHLLA